MFGFQMPQGAPDPMGQARGMGGSLLNDAMRRNASSLLGGGLNTAHNAQSAFGAGHALGIGAPAMKAGMGVVQNAAPRFNEQAYNQSILAANPGAGYASGSLQATYSPMEEYARQQARAQDAWDHSRQSLYGLQFQRMANPYGANNAGLQAMLQQNRGMVGGGLQSALIDNQRNLAQRGITTDSGLAQNQNLQARLMAAKQLSGMDTAANAENYQRAAAFDTRMNELENAFNESKARALSAADFQTGNAYADNARQMAMMPGQLQAQMLANTGAGIDNQYAQGTLADRIAMAGLGRNEAQTRLGFLPDQLRTAIEQSRAGTVGQHLSNQMEQKNLDNYLLNALLRLVPGILEAGGKVAGAAMMGG